MGALFQLRSFCLCRFHNKILNCVAVGSTANVSVSLPPALKLQEYEKQRRAFGELRRPLLKQVFYTKLFFSSC
jgi:hypothetical protein